MQKIKISPPQTDLKNMSETIDIQFHRHSYSHGIRNFPRLVRLIIIRTEIEDVSEF